MTDNEIRRKLLTPLSDAQAAELVLVAREHVDAAIRATTVQPRALIRAPRGRYLRRQR